MEDFESREAPRRTHDSAARMRCRAAHVEPLNRRAVARPACYWSQEEKLFERKLALKDVAFAQAGGALDIERRQHLASENEVLQIRGILSDCVYYSVAKSFALLVPRAARQLVRGVLHEAGHDVLARGRHRGIRQRRNHDVDVGTAGKFTVFSLVIRPLHVFG